MKITSSERIMKTILVSEIAGKNAISMHSGSNLYNRIQPILKKGEKLRLDFQGVELFASPFFNASIGYILKDISIDELKEHIVIENINKVGNQVLNLVIRNAIEYYSNKSSKGFNDLINNVMDDDE